MNSHTRKNSKSPGEYTDARARAIIGRNASTSDLEPLPIKSQTKYTIEISDQQATLHDAKLDSKSGKMEFVLAGSANMHPTLSRPARLGMKSALVKRKSHRHTASLQPDNNHLLY